MKEFINILLRFVPRYKRYLMLNVTFNLLAAFLTLFSFALIIPILEMLFKINSTAYAYMPLGSGSLKEVLVNDFYFYVQTIIGQWGQSVALASLAVILVVMTALKTGSAYLSAFFMVPIRAGVVRGIGYELQGCIRHWQKRHARLKIFLTGGDRYAFSDAVRVNLLTDSHLVARGLNRLLQYQQEQQGQHAR